MCTLCWTIYATFAKLDKVGRIGMLCSNGISIFINIAQILIWTIFYKKNIYHPEEHTENEEDDQTGTENDSTPNKNEKLVENNIVIL